MPLRLRAIVLVTLILQATIVLGIPARAQVSTADVTGNSKSSSSSTGQDRWFDAPGPVNPGLGLPPPSLDRSTPAETMSAFLHYAGKGDWSDAAQLLDLSFIPVGKQAERGRTLARQLYAVIDRKTFIDWGKLIDRPDGMNAQLSSSSGIAGQPRRSILLAVISLRDHPVSIRLNRMKPPDGPPVWLFPSQTLRDVPALYDLYGPKSFERMLPDSLRRKVFLTLRGWELIALPLLVGAAALLGWVTSRLIDALAARLRGTGIARFVIAARPALITFLITLLVAMSVRHFFTFSGRIDVVLQPLLSVGYIASVLWLLVNVVDQIIDNLVHFDGDDLSAVGEGQERKRIIATNIGAFRRVVIAVVVLCGLGITLAQSNVLRTLGFSLLASAGALTLLAAYGARDVLANVMSSMQIAFNRSARIGDRVVYRDRLCSVERIKFTYVQLRVWTGERLVVPVNQFVSEAFENWTMETPELIRTVELKLGHQADVEKLRQVYHEILDDMQERLSESNDRGVFVTNQDVFGQTVLFEVPCPDPNTAWVTAAEVREKLIAAGRQMEKEGQPVFPTVAAAATN